MNEVSVANSGLNITEDSLIEAAELNILKLVPKFYECFKLKFAYLLARKYKQKQVQKIINFVSTVTFCSYFQHIF